MIHRRHFLAVLLILTACAPIATPTSMPLNPASQPAAPTAVVVPAAPRVPELILATTTSTQDSGLLDLLVPLFEGKTGYRVKTIAVGSGQSLALASKGEADVVLAHSPAAEIKFMEDGFGLDRLLIMHNDFILLGPPDDPAGVKKTTSISAAMAAIATRESPFFSRGDNSGTHVLELDLWKKANIEQKGKPWYQEVGQGMGAVLNIANEKSGYTIADRGTFLSRKKTLQMDIVRDGDKSLLNVYHVMQVNPAKNPKVNADGAKAFSQFMVDKETQSLIATFGVDKYGAPLFFADAGKKEEEVAG